MRVFTCYQISCQGRCSIARRRGAATPFAYRVCISAGGYLQLHQEAAVRSIERSGRDQGAIRFGNYACLNATTRVVTPVKPGQLRRPFEIVNRSPDGSRWRILRGCCSCEMTPSSKISCRRFTCRSTAFSWSFSRTTTVSAR